MTGRTFSSTGIATSGAYTTYSLLDFGSYDHCFVTKFSPAGEQLWGTYIYASHGVNGYYTNLKAAGDDNGNTYIIGEANYIFDPHYYSTEGALEEESSNSHSFIMKLDENGSRVWGTFYGSSEVLHHITSVNVSADGYLYIAGNTVGNDLGTPGVYQPENLYWTSVDSTDNLIVCYLAKFTLDGEKVWHSYISSSEFASASSVPIMDRKNIYVNSITSDELGNVYIKGDVGNMVLGGIADPGSFQEAPHAALGNTKDQFIMKFDNSGQKVWGTYFGGKDKEYGFVHLYGLNKIQVTGDGQAVYFSAQVQSSSGTPTPDMSNGCGALSFVDSNKSLIARLDVTGHLVWCAYFDAPITDIAISAPNNEGSKAMAEIYYVSKTSLNGMATPGSFKPSKPALESSGLFGKIIETCPVVYLDLDFSFPNLIASEGYEQYVWYHNGDSIGVSSIPIFTISDTTGTYFYKVSKCLCDFVSETYHFSPSDINDQEIGSLKVYPNPAKDYLYLDLEGHTGEIQFSVQNMLAQEVYHDSWINGKEQVKAIPLKNFEKGFYIFQIHIGTHQFWGRFVKIE